MTAVLGPTNTGKTHLAIERMTAYPSGVIGLPLRLLAREVYHRVAQKVGVANVALITGEEKISPPNARFLVCTVEAMPSKTDVEFVAIDEVQLATDLERGHVFTDRLLHLRGAHETMLLGAQTIEKTLIDLLPGLKVVNRPRMSVLTYSGSKKITRLPRRSAIVAFSADEVYAIAELIRRQRGGAAVVMGSLSPRTRNAQVELYQAGEVDFIVATDAIGMGLNLDIDHVAFAQDQKFDGYQYRRLTAAEFGQIAGRAGRHTRDGTFGTSGRISPLPDELVEALETHQFAPAKTLTWRNRNLDYRNVEDLKASLQIPSESRLLMKAPQTADSRALDLLSKDPAVADRCDTEAATRLLWETCRIPDYRRISPSAHSEIIKSVFCDIIDHGSVAEHWLKQQIGYCDRTDGEIDAISARIANIRTWTYLSNHANWVDNAAHWQEVTRNVEDRLSDALHENLTKRFLDRRTSVLMKKLRENAMLDAEIAENGNVSVEGHHVGQLQGFQFVPDASAQGPEAKAASAAAMKALAAEIEKRAERLIASPNSDFTLANDGTIRWLGTIVAKTLSGESAYEPKILILADEQLTGNPLEKVRGRIGRWLANHINTTLKPLQDLAADTSLEGMARGVAFQLHEKLGILNRQAVASEIKELNQDMRAGLRKHGVRFGAYHVFMPMMLKPAPVNLLSFLWALKHDRLGEKGLTEVPEALAAGRTSFATDPEIDSEIYNLCGYRVMGSKAVRVDILERLADLIRPATMWKPASDSPKPEGAIDGRSFYVTPSMMSILGATHEDMEKILKGLGYRFEKKLRDEIIPPEEQSDSEESKSETSDGSPVDEAVAPTEAGPVDETTTENTSSENEPTEQAASEESEPTEPATILVWRYGGNDRARGNNSRNQKNRKQDPRAHKGNQKNRGSKPNRPPKAKTSAKPKEIDPDSPFAKLAALKENLKQ